MRSKNLVNPVNPVKLLPMDSAQNNMVHTLLADATAQLRASPSPALDAEILLAHVLGKSRSWLRAFDDRIPDAAETEQFMALLKHREAGTPIAHLVGQREFWSLPLQVDNHTLIPRPDTELLVAQALEYIPLESSPRILDLGTGSGAIALALAAERPQADITATDISTAALSVAKTNARLLAVKSVNFIVSDWFSAVPAQRFDVIVSNPPYIAENDPHLNQGDVRFEPQQALVAGADGLSALRTIIARAPGYLAPGGWLLVEHGYTQAAAVQGLFADTGLVEIHSQRDLGGQMRVTKGQKK